MLRLLPKPNLFFAAIVFCWTWGTSAAEVEIKSITVLADRALTLPLTQLASDYTRKMQISINVTFAPAFEQGMALESGENADIFISAHPQTFITLRKRGKLKRENAIPLATTRVVLVATQHYQKFHKALTPDIFRQLRKRKDFLLAVANPAASTEGYYADQVLKHLRRRIFLADAVVEMQNTSDLIDFLETTEGFGLMLESDALQSRIVHKIATIPDEWYETPQFFAALVSNPFPDEAKHFIAFLQTKKAQRILIKNGLYPTLRKPSRPQS